MKVKRPLNRSIIIECSIFLGLLCIISSILLYVVYTSNMYKRYKKQLDSVITYVESKINHDDMVECLKDYDDSSEDYQTFQAFFNNLIDNYPDMHYLYLMQVLPEGQEYKGCAIVEICAANSSEELGTEMELHLGDCDVTWFDEAQIKEYRRIINSQKDAYFRNETAWGVDYTLARPVCDSNGNYYGLLCADIAIDEINTTIYRNIWINITMILAVGILFIVLLIIWMRRNVITPLKNLESSVTEYANIPHGQRKPEELIYNAPKIHTKNEVEALADAYEKLALEMHNYVIGLVAAEDEAKGLKVHAYHDALTHVKNKAAYDEMRENMLKDIEDEKAEFGLVMADINSLKNINDLYGHEKGDEYIKGACKIICDIYVHSNVYRIGGDEFVVLLQNRDYQNREKLLEDARNEFNEAMFDEARDPWNRYSAAIGMAVWSPGLEFDSVFSSADHKMYEQKALIKEKYKDE